LGRVSIFSGRDTKLEHYGFLYDEVGNVTKITDYRADADWPSSAKPVTREFEYPQDA
jgi:hypothetical protein